MGALRNKFHSNQQSEISKDIRARESEVARVIVGPSGRHPKNADRAILRGHILIEGVPGLADLDGQGGDETLGLSFKRIQFHARLDAVDIIARRC